MIVCTWTWPEVRGSATFNKEVDEFKAGLETGAKRVAEEVERFNAQLPDRAADALRRRQQEVMGAPRVHLRNHNAAHAHPMRLR